MTIAQLVLTVLGSAGISAVLVKMLSRGVDNATAEKIRAEAKEIATRAAGAELDILRQVIADVREDAAKERGKAETVIEKLELRLEKIEERERHMLTRAAVHEAWDQLAFAFIAGHDASFPPPPPIRPPVAELPQSASDPDDN
jgi:hypothetical protein